MASVTAARRPAVLADLLPGALVRDAVLIAGAAALTGLSAQIQIHLPGTPVPVTGQTFAVLLSGAALGGTRGVLAMLLYVGAGLAGVPWFAGGSHGYVGATSGYLVGFVVAGAAVGALAGRGGDRTVLRAALTMLLGTAIIYICGASGLMISLGVGVSKAFELGVRPFLVGDVIKLVLAAGLLPAAWKVADHRARPED
jgi:biotin transport system substrate-specific component